MKRFISDFSKFGDSYHLRKTEFPKVDITLGTVRDRLLITFVNEKLIHEFTERQKEGCYIKTNSGVNFLSLKQFLGDGLLLSEGNEWRYKRKIMSDIFSFEFVKDQLDFIITTTVEKCERIREKAVDGRVEFEADRLFQ